MGKEVTVTSLFSGCGGLDLSFIMAGCKVIWANDNNTWACKTYRKNIGEHIVENNISDIKIKEIPKSDIILGGFPCQDFSMLWKRGGINTDRGNLYKYFVDVVKTKKPKVFVAENVKGILTANKGEAVKQILKDFSKVGYKVKIHKVNFADYGTPQLRERVFIIGINKKIGKEHIFPEPTHNENCYVSAKEALKGVKKVKHNNRHQNIHQSTIEKLKLIPPGGNFTSIPKDSPFYVKGMISHVYRRLHPDKPSTTIIAGGGGGTWGYHYKENRPLTNRERARLFGYPDNFVFEGTITEVRRQIGNSVPPNGALPLAKSILDLLGDRK